jgi:hypothetical protein
MTAAIRAPKLDPCEEHFHVPSPHPGLLLFPRYLPPAGAAAAEVGEPR